jgi:hypothetical protein
MSYFSIAAKVKGFENGVNHQSQIHPRPGVKHIHSKRGYRKRDYRRDDRALRAKARNQNVVSCDINDRTDDSGHERVSK